MKFHLSHRSLVKRVLRPKNLLCFPPFLFSWWLMTHTLSYENGSILIAARAWSDFSWTIPMVRSFSLGSNFPVEAPLYPGQPIHYHFLFYLLCGLLEKMGLRIDYAINLPSILGFTLFIIMLYYFAKRIFNSTAVGFLSIFFILFNGSLSFLYFFVDHPLSFSTFYNIITSTKFTSFGPYDNRLVSAFWNLNIYTNQRHLAPSFAFSLFILYIFLDPVFNKSVKRVYLKSIILGVALALFFFFHIAIFIMTAITIFSLSLLFKKLRVSGFLILFTTGLLAFPQYKYMNGTSHAFNTLFHFGYLIQNPITVWSFSYYWFLNLGLHLLFMPVGFVLASTKVKKIGLAFFVFFLIGNLFQFSPDIATNHKFFNYFMLIGSMFSAYAVIIIWKKYKRLRLLTIFLVLFLVLSGIIDFFPIYNDTKGPLADYPKNPDIQWVIKNTPKDSVFLNTSFLYAPESIAGRKIFLGWPYFAWSAGYNTTERNDEIKKVLSSENKNTVCAYLRRNNLSYISITQPSEDFPFSPEWFEKNFKSSYVNKENTLKIYARKNNCT